MRYPQIGKQPTRTVSVPQLSGGLNLRDSVSMVADNQLTESLNMWFKDGVLKTRPGLCADEEFYLSKQRYTSDKENDIRTFPYVKDGKGRTLAAIRRVFYLDDDTEKLDTEFSFFWIGGNSFASLQSLTVYTECDISFLAEKNGVIYAFLDNEEIYKSPLSGSLYWTQVYEHECYIPTVATNLKPSSASGGGNILEPYNLLSPYYKAVYSAVDKDSKSHNSGEEGKYYSSMIYHLPFAYVPSTDGTTPWWVGKKIKVEYYDLEGNLYTFIGELTGNLDCISGASDGKKFKLTGGQDIIFYTEDDDTIAHMYVSDYLINNLTITAPCPTEPDKAKIFGMTRSVWFGGAAGGLNGGGRLFLCGNKYEPSLLQWSSLNNPLYFPENNYAYVGSASSKLCTFGKQDETLVLFKENETYYTYYVQNNDITAEQLFNQSVVDYESSSVYFPIIQLNDSIGCDCSDSVQLCRNRLVWTHSNGKVYSLVTQSQYNERNIFEISEMIRPELKSWGEELKNAISADWEGYYVLALGNKLYLMDYNSYGYQYIYSYSKAEDANVKIPWYVWEIPDYKCITGNFVVPARFYTAEGKLGVIGYLHADRYENCGYGGYYFDAYSNHYADSVRYENKDKSPNELDILSKPIPCHAQTKIFDFSAPNIRKNIKSVGLSVGNNGGTPINVKFITDCGTEEDVIVLDGADTRERTAGFLDSRILYPCIKSVLRFGVEFSCEGLMAIEGINLSYRYLGGAR